MAVQGSPDVRIYSSVRPLQIQRSFEGSTEAVDAAESVKREVTVEKHSSVSITSQVSSSTGMSVIQPSTDGGIKIATAPLSITPGTVIVKTGSSPVSPTTPATVVIRSSAAAAAVPQGTTSPQTGQNVVVIKSSATGATSSQQQSVTQSSVVIRSASASQQAIHPSSPSKIIINPSPIVQSRITIGATATPPAPDRDGVEAEKHEGSSSTVPQARRSSLTIKAAPSPPPTPPVAEETVTSDHVPPASNPVPTEPTAEQHPTPSMPNNAEDLSEKVRPKKPAGPSFEEILEKFNISSVFYVTLVVLLAGVLCILGEGEIPLSWILAAISFFSLVSFIALRL